MNKDCDSIEMENDGNKNNSLETDLKLYEECCKSYHRVDDFRAKLLGFIPLVTGAGIFASLSDKNGDNLAPYLVEVGIFGLVVTFGLLIYELKGIQKCTQFIKFGIYIEKNAFQTRGQFVELSANASKVINEPVASGIVYSIVLAAWTYIVLHSALCLSKISLYVFTGLVFFISFAFVYIYWKQIAKDLNK